MEDKSRQIIERIKFTRDNVRFVRRLLEQYQYDFPEELVEVTGINDGSIAILESIEEGLSRVPLLLLKYIGETTENIIYGKGYYAYRVVDDGDIDYYGVYDERGGDHGYSKDQFELVKNFRAR